MFFDLVHYRFTLKAKTPIGFFPIRDPDSRPKRQQTPPRGFIVKPPLNAKGNYGPGEAIVFDFLLIGRMLGKMMNEPEKWCSRFINK